MIPMGRPLKRNPIGRRVGFEVLVEKRQTVERHHVELERRRGKLREGIGDLKGMRFFAEAADNNGDGVGHETILSGTEPINRRS